MGKYIGKTLPALGEIVKDCAKKVGTVECAGENDTGYDFMIDLSSKAVSWQVSEIVKSISAFVENLGERKEDMEKNANDKLPKK